MAPDTEQMLPLAEEATRLIKALAHPERLMICCQLRDGELSVGDIERMLAIPQPRLSRELSKLRTEGILGTRRDSRTVVYHLKDDRIRSIIDTLCDVMLIKHERSDANRLSESHGKEPLQ